MTPEEVISPWRAAKPRKPLREFQSPPRAPAPTPSKPSAWLGWAGLLSPPNSEHKESTRRLQYSEDEVEAEVKVKLRLTLKDRLLIRRAMTMSSRPAK